MYRVLTPVVILAPAVTGAVLWGLPVWSLGCAVMAATGAAWYLGRCRHPRPLGLVPPTLGADGQRQGAQWFCGQCGRYWPAVFEHDHAPVQRFHGYDESKARAAAKRAADLADRQRELAVRRGGMPKRPASRPAPPAARPVPIRERRIAG
jgi:hypothetical protein